MSTTAGPALDVSEVFAEREGRRRREQAADDQLKLREREALAEFKERLDGFELREATIAAGLDRIRRAFDRGETELMVTAFPSSFCTDGGRAIGNAYLPPLNELTREQEVALAENPPWVGTMPAGCQRLFEYWKANLKPGGFRFSARIISYPENKPGDVGLFFSWPKSRLPEA